METTTKTWDLFKSHFRAADRDMRSDATIGTDGYHGTPYATTNYVVTREVDLLARLAASELTLARAMAQAYIAPTIDTAANMSTITSEPPCAYCWAHGFCKNINHTSTPCFYPGEGQQVDATASNTMGGTTTNFVPNPRTRNGSSRGS
jgi:hypothetical protein